MPAYSPQDVTVTVNGIPLSGFAEDTFVTVTQDSMDGTATRGADGFMAYSVDKALPQATLTFTALQGSSANSILFAALASMKATGLVLTAAVQVTGSTESVTWGSCVITKAADIVLGRENQAREWTLTGQALMRPGTQIL